MESQGQWMVSVIFEKDHTEFIYFFIFICLRVE